MRFLLGSHIVQVNAVLGNALSGSFGASVSINVGFANCTFPRSYTDHQPVAGEAKFAKETLQRSNRSDQQIA